MTDPVDPLARLAAPPIFVVGMHRSGTTWVYEMLAGHPEVAGVFESGLFSADLGVAPIFSPVHWYADAKALEEDRRFFGAAFRLNQLLTRDQALADTRALAASWLIRAMESGHRFLVEKTPQHLYTMPLIAELFPGSMFVHVIRDGRDVAVSVEEAARSWPRGRVRSADPRAVAGRWAFAIETARREADAHSLRYAEVRFELLKQHPESELARLFDFCRIPADAALVSSIVDRASLEARRASSADAFRRRGAAGDWRERFGLLERLRFDRAAGALLVELGYEHSRRWWWPGRAADPTG